MPLGCVSGDCRQWGYADTWTVLIFNWLRSFAINNLTMAKYGRMWVSNVFIPRSYDLSGPEKNVNHNMAVSYRFGHYNTKSLWQCWNLMHFEMKLFAPFQN